jgi:hypothetical protein
MRIAQQLFAPDADTGGFAWPRLYIGLKLRLGGVFSQSYFRRGGLYLGRRAAIFWRNWLTSRAVLIFLSPSGSMGQPSLQSQIQSGGGTQHCCISGFGWGSLGHKGCLKSPRGPRRKASLSGLAGIKQLRRRRFLLPLPIDYFREPKNLYPFWLWLNKAKPHHVHPCQKERL